MSRRRPASRRARGRYRVAGVAAAALVLAVGVIALVEWPRPAPLFAGTAKARPDTAWDDLFQSYGNSSGAWSGGDGAQALALPDGATMWFFADTFLGGLAPGGTRSPFSTGNAHNSAVLYRQGALGPTYAQPPGFGGYSGDADYTWVTPPPPYPADRYELINGDQVIVHGTVYKFYQLADRDLHPGGFGYKLVGTVMETFTVDPVTDALIPAGGTPLGIEDSSASNPFLWGAATLVSGGYIYLYGVRPYNGPAAPFSLYLARVPAAGLAAGAAWQYYDGAGACAGPGGWTPDPRSAVPLRTGASAGFSVTDVHGTYVLLTGGTSGAANPSDAVAFYAQCPAGFSPASPEYLVYQPGLPDGYLAYEYRIIPQFSRGKSVLVSYSISATGPGGNLAAVSVYRPHFLDVTLPGLGGPAGAVTEPTP